MKLTSEQIQHIAKVARLKMSDEEINDLLPELNDILNYMKQLEDLDIENEAPIDQITGLQNQMEEDEIKPYLNTDELISSSPQPVVGNMIEVKKTI